LAIAFLMVSRLPVFSGKRVGKRVSPEMVVPVFVVVVLCFALLISYPWTVLAIGTLAYLASLPFGFASYRNHERKTAAGMNVAQPGTGAALQGDSPSLSPAHPSSEPSQSPEHPERPTRLN
jgi:CDP-diacylglycerol--serine O-phosphatidyltransferase